MLQGVEWKCHPEAEQLLETILLNCSKQSEALYKLETELLNITSTRLFDWVDHIEVGYDAGLEKDLLKSGFVSDAARGSYRIFHHPGAQIPFVVVRDDSDLACSVAIKVECIEDFLMVRGQGGWVEGSFFSKYRSCCFNKHNGIALYAVERRSALGIEPHIYDTPFIEKIHLAYQKWQTRPRSAETEEEEEDALRASILLAEEMVQLIGQNKAACIVLDIERKYWQAKNTAGQIQKNRQDKMGLGWANHDHHTFRSSRKHFKSLVRLFEILGFHCREQFWAGKEAGWGAQVMEHPHCPLVLFLDVDLSPEEIGIDFAHHALPDLAPLGTIGLWCALHGESILKAGMHHLEAQFLFDKLEEDLKVFGIKTMAPFSSFSYLKQAFTQGEIWPVSSRKIDYLVQNNLITPDQGEKFRVQGAIGSHLENLQRREGYKGFNQNNVSTIIQKTDPRAIVSSN